MPPSSPLLLALETSCDETAAAVVADPPVASKDSRKLVRDSFTMPKDEYATINTLKRAMRCFSVSQRSK